MKRNLLSSTSLTPPSGQMTSEVFPLSVDTTWLDIRFVFEQPLDGVAGFVGYDVDLVTGTVGPVTAWGVAAFAL